MLTHRFIPCSKLLSCVDARFLELLLPLRQNDRKFGVTRENILKFLRKYKIPAPALDFSFQ